MPLIRSIAVFDHDAQVLEEARAALEGYEVYPFDNPADAIVSFGGDAIEDTNAI